MLKKGESKALFKIKKALISGKFILNNMPICFGHIWPSSRQTESFNGRLEQSLPGFVKINRKWLVMESNVIEWFKSLSIGIGEMDEWDVSTKIPEIQLPCHLNMLDKEEEVRNQEKVPCNETRGRLQPGKLVGNVSLTRRWDYGSTLYRRAVLSYTWPVWDMQQSRLICSGT